MGKITVTLEDNVEKKLRIYVSQNFPEQPFGKLSEVVNQAVKEFLEPSSK